MPRVSTDASRSSKPARPAFSSSSINSWSWPFSSPRQPRPALRATTIPTTWAASARPRPPWRAAPRGGRPREQPGSAPTTSACAPRASSPPPRG
eukprot:scaffold37873_cov27-Tisochrysis_lutea.AAC.1